MKLLDTQYFLRRITRSYFQYLVSTVAMAVLGVFLPIAPAVHAEASNNLNQTFIAAANEFGVPSEILKAISYKQTRWEDYDGEPNVRGGYGIMGLTTQFKQDDMRGDPSRPLDNYITESGRTLDEAAALIGVTPDALKNDDTQNIRGSAALLAKYAKELRGGTTPSSLEEWSSAVARFGSFTSSEATKEFTTDVFTTINNGVQEVTSNGQTVSLNAQGVNLSNLQINIPGFQWPGQNPSGQQNETECPPTITCKFNPALFGPDPPPKDKPHQPIDPKKYGNYDHANRPHDLDIKYIVIHDGEGTYQSIIDWLKDPRSDVGAHYVVRSSDGEVTQMIKTKDVGWHAGNWYMNQHSIGIELEGNAHEGKKWYTEELYRSTAQLVRYLADKYHIPVDRQHIIFHEEIPGLTQVRVPLMHWDPGPFFNVGRFMDLAYAPTVPTAGPDSKVVKIAPKFKDNQQILKHCFKREKLTGVCLGDIRDLPKQPVNFVYLRTEPRDDAPVLTDQGKRPDGSPGTNLDEDWSGRALYGQQFAVAERRNDGWLAIWFSGQKGWFRDPGPWWDGIALPTHSKLITPKAGSSSIPVYGRPIPEPDAFATTGAPVQAIQPLQYTIPAGQFYTTYDTNPKNDYYHTNSFDWSTPGDGTITVGKDKYIAVTFNHRHAFVRADDVDVISDPWDINWSWPWP